MNKKVLKAAAVGAISVVTAGVIAAKVGADQTKLPLLADDIPVS